MIHPWSHASNKLISTRRRMKMMRRRIIGGGRIIDASCG
jgi:hypothetical protein